MQSSFVDKKNSYSLLTSGSRANYNKPSVQCSCLIGSFVYLLMYVTDRGASVTRLFSSVQSLISSCDGPTSFLYHYKMSDFSLLPRYFTILSQLKKTIPGKLSICQRSLISPSITRKYSFTFSMQRAGSNSFSSIVSYSKSLSRVWHFSPSSSKL